MINVVLYQDIISVLSIDLFLYPICYYNRGYNDLNNQPCTKCNNNMVYLVLLVIPLVAKSSPIIATAKQVALESKIIPNPKH